MKQAKNPKGLSGLNRAPKQKIYPMGFVLKFEPPIIGKV